MDPTDVGSQFLSNPVGTAVGVAIIALVSWLTRKEVVRRRSMRPRARDPRDDDDDDDDDKTPRSLPPRRFPPNRKQRRGQARIARRLARAAERELLRAASAAERARSVRPRWVVKS